MKTTILALGLALSPSSGRDATDRATRCPQICARPRGCVEGAYDVSAWATRRRDNAVGRDAADNRVDLGERCLDDRSGVSSVGGCGDACVGIVP